MTKSTQSVSPPQLCPQLSQQSHTMAPLHPIKASDNATGWSDNVLELLTISL